MGVKIEKLKFEWLGTPCGGASNVCARFLGFQVGGLTFQFTEACRQYANPGGIELELNCILCSDGIILEF